MFEWFMENWLVITAISAGLYVLVLILEKVVGKNKNKKIDLNDRVQDKDIVEEV